MKGITDKTKCLASLATFRELYNKQQDIYFIVSEFAKCIIITKSLYSFELEIMHRNLIDENGIDIPRAVVKSALNRLPFLSHEGTQYKVNEQFSSVKNISICNKEAIARKKNNEILEGLYSFIEKRRNIELSKDEKEKIEDYFCTYIIDCEFVSDYSQDISLYIVEKEREGTTDFISTLNNIKQGMIVYTGLSYITGASRDSNMDKKLTIYLETEMLFNFASFNGDLFKTLFDEFYSIIEQVNHKSYSKNGKNIITLKYLSETEKDINDYFYSAECIVNGKMPLDISKNAMTNIVNGCKEAYEIAEKKAEFFDFIHSKNITKEDDDIDYYEKKYLQYNIENDIDFGRGNDSSKKMDDLRKLSHINVRRGGRSRNFFNGIGYILLTGNHALRELALDNRIKKDGEVPLVTSLAFLTDHFWFLLNKNIAIDSSLKSFDIISKAQIALSNQISDNIGRLFNEAKEKMDNGSLTEDKAKVIIAGLMADRVSPEEVLTNENIINTVCSLNMASVELYRTNLENQKRSDIREKEELIEKTNATERKFNKTLEAYKTKENKDEIDKFNSDLINYKIKRNKWVNNKTKQVVLNNFLWAFGYFMFTSLLVILSFLIKTNKIYNIFIACAICFVNILLPIISPIFNYNNIKNAFTFILHYKKEKQKIIIMKQKEFKSNNKMPVKILSSMDDIIKIMSI